MKSFRSSGSIFSKNEYTLRFNSPLLFKSNKIFCLSMFSILCILVIPTLLKFLDASLIASLIFPSFFIFVFLESSDSEVKTGVITVSLTSSVFIFFKTK